MTVGKICLGVICLTLMAGCMHNRSRYTWNGYDEKLHRHYKNPAKSEEFVEQLKEVVVVSEESGKVPPGVYAEYGYVLYEKGDYPEAMRYFKLEHDKWPESRFFMVKMMQNGEARVKQGRKSERKAPFSGTEVAGSTPEAKEASK